MTTIGKKAEYVRAARHGGKRATGNHHCHWPGCEKKVPPAMWGCKAHWFALPATLRNKIWRAYRPGQEISKTPSAEYLAVAGEVQAWIASGGGR